MWFQWLRKFGRGKLKGARRAQARHSRRLFFRPWVEVLEDRIPPAVVNWTNPAGGAWETAGNWSMGQLPGADDDVVIPAFAGSISISHGSGTDTIKSLTSSEDLVLSGGTLDVASTLQVTGAVVTLEGGTLGGATVLAGTRLVGTSSGGTLDGVTVNGDLQLAGAWVGVTNGLTLNGTIAVGDSSGNYGRLDFSGSQTLDGTGSAVFGSNSQNSMRVATAGDTLTIGPDITIRGQTGNIGYSPDWGGPADVSFINQGIIDADTAGGVITINGSNWSNTGQIRAETGSMLRFMNATLDNTGLAITADGGTVEIVNSTITSGTLVATDNAASFVQFSGDVTLNGVPWQEDGAGEFRVYQTTARLLGDYADHLPAGYRLVVETGGAWGGGAQLSLAGGVFTNDGTIELHGGYGWGWYNPWPIWATLDIGPGTTVTGSGNIMLQTPACLSAQITGAAGAVLTIGPGESIQGNGQIQVNVVNQGQIEADVNGQSLTLSGWLSNSGTVEVLGGGSLTVAEWLSNDSSMHVAGGGTLSVSGALTNSSNIDAISGSSLTFSGDVTNTGVIEVSGGGTLSFAMLLSNDGAVRAFGSSLTLAGGVQKAGTLEFSGTGILTLGGPVNWDRDFTALAGETVRFTGATFDNTGHVITADGGTVEIANSTITGGTLVATDNAASFVQFSGDVTLNGVPWEADGSGEFRVYQTTARLLGDYANHLPAGYTLVVDVGPAGGGGSAQLNLDGGVFTNDGTIELRGGYGNGSYYVFPVYATLSLPSDFTLAGAGQVVMSSAGPWDWWAPAQITGAPGVKLTIGAQQVVHGWGAIQVQMDNHGRIEADAAGHTLAISGPLANDGTVRTLGGGYFVLSGSLTNSGVVNATGSGRLTVSGLTVNAGMLGDSGGATLSLDGGLTDTGSLQWSNGATLNLGGLVSTPAVLLAEAGTMLRFTNATLDNTGRTITADGGTVEISNSTINGGSLRATDNASSFVQFSGDVTLNGVPWEADGSGEFRVYQTTARLLGDYANHLPAGYTLVVDVGPAGGGGSAQLNLDGGVFTNDGTIELRGGYGNGSYYVFPVYATLSLPSDFTLAGAGQVVMSSAGPWDWWAPAQITGAPGVKLTIGAQQVVHGWARSRCRWTNHGRIEADAAGHTLAISGPLANDGTVRHAWGWLLRAVWIAY